MFFKYVIIFFMSSLFSKDKSPAQFWSSYNEKEKIAFINGAFGAISKLKAHHKSEVKKQYMHNDNWVEPYYIERYYDIINEYLSEEVGYNIQIISMHLDAFYTNSDNTNIPIMEALRIVSLHQDGDKKKANSRLLRSQQRYNSVYSK